MLFQEINERRNKLRYRKDQNFDNFVECRIPSLPDVRIDADEPTN